MIIQHRIPNPIDRIRCLPCVTASIKHKADRSPKTPPAIIFPCFIFLTPICNPPYGVVTVYENAAKGILTPTSTRLIP